MPLKQLEGARDAVFKSWNNPRANYYRRQNKISDDLGTAVNVQSMVFGNMGDDSGTGVGFTRNPSTGEKMFYGEYLTNAQGEDVVAGIRTPKPIAELREGHARRLQAAARDYLQARKALSRHPGLRVHHREGQALHAPDPQRQTHRRRGRPHRGRNGEGKTDYPGRSAHARGAGTARPAPAQSDRSEGQAQSDRQGASRFSGRRHRPGRF